MREVVPTVPNFVHPYGRDGGRARTCNRSQLNLGMVSGLWSGVREALPTPYEAIEPELEAL
jgi:hypothetical protein